MQVRETLRRLGAMVLCAVVLASCGGGGGGGSAGLSVTADKSAVNLVAVAGIASGSQTINFTLTGGTGSYYGLILLDQAHVLTASFTPTSSTTAAVTIAPAYDANPPGGRTSGNITLELCTDSNCANVAWSKTIPYTLTIFTIDTSGVSISGYEGAVTSSTLAVSPPDTQGQMTVHGGTSTDYPWLSATHGNNGSIDITASGAGLVAGSYQGLLTVSFPGSAMTAPVQIPVSFSVGDGTIAPPAKTIDLTVSASASSLVGSLAVSFHGTQSPVWSASSNQPWLTLTSAAGTGAGQIAYAVDTSKLTDVPNWSSSAATVTISASGLSDVSVPVTLNKKLPEIYAVWPDPAIAGRAGQATITGRGFAQLSTNSTITVGGVGSASVSATSDTKAVMDLPALSAGQYMLSVPNAAGLASHTTSLVAATLAPMSYATAANAGSKRTPLFDAGRNAVYVVNLDQQTLVRYRLISGQWQVDGLPVANISELALSPDQQTLYVTSGATRLLAIDPDTLQIRSTFTVPASFNFYYCSYCSYAGNEDGRLPITSNGRLWLTDSWGSWSALYYFDLLDSTFKRYPSPAGATNGLFSEPRLYPSGDGSMMMVMATNPSSIFPSWRYDTSTDSLTSPSGIPVAYRVSLNASGSRMLVEWGSLYDTTSMSLIGKAQSTSAGSVVLSVLSPDGQRVYSLVTASASSDLIDHVEVFDANQAVPGTSNLVSLGQIPVADQAGYCAPSSSLSCNWIGGLTISSFGNTLFWTANERLVVIPIPSSISGIASAPKTQLLKARL